MVQEQWLFGCLAWGHVSGLALTADGLYLDLGGVHVVNVRSSNNSSDGTLMGQWLSCVRIEHAIMAEMCVVVEEQRCHFDGAVQWPARQWLRCAHHEACN